MCIRDRLTGAIQALTAFVDALGDVLDDLVPPGAGDLPGTSTGAGVGSTSLAQSRTVSDAFGGWIDANCDPALNPSGCLTFIFKTNGDRAKGTGWDAWVDCQDRGIELSADDLWENAVCEGLTGDAPTANVAIAAATISGMCADTLTSNMTDDVIVTITGATGECFRDTVRAGQPITAQEYPVGFYMISHVLLSDSEKSTNSSLTVVAPNLASNDQVSASIGNGCKLILGLDELLEGAVCDTNQGVSYLSLIHI